MNRRLIIAVLASLLIASPAFASGPDDKPTSADKPDSKPVISLKANMGGSNMELDVEKSQEGVTVKGTMDEKTVTASGKRQEDGSVRVEVQKDKDTVVEMTIHPEALEGAGKGTK